MNDGKWTGEASRKGGFRMEEQEVGEPDTDSADPNFLQDGNIRTRGRRGKKILKYHRCE
jgi:hypothetical protein